MIEIENFSIMPEINKSGDTSQIMLNISANMYYLGDHVLMDKFIENDKDKR
jgi:hypothetical protein